MFLVVVHATTMQPSSARGACRRLESATPGHAGDLSQQHLGNVCLADAAVAGNARGSQLRAFAAPQAAEDAAFDDAHRPPARLRMGSVKFGQVQSCIGIEPVARPEASDTT